MLSITLVCVGKMRETYYISAFAEYAKRLGAYCRFDLVELPEQRLPERPSQKEIHAALEKEAQAIRARIPKGAAVIAMCVEGKLLSSEALARQLAGYAAGGTSKVCFLVGGSFGLDEGLKREASLRLSMSPMTFRTIWRASCSPSRSTARARSTRARNIINETGETTWRKS